MTSQAGLLRGRSIKEWELLVQEELVSIQISYREPASTHFELVALIQAWLSNCSLFPLTSSYFLLLRNSSALNAVSYSLGFLHPQTLTQRSHFVPDSYPFGNDLRTRQSCIQLFHCGLDCWSFSIGFEG